MGIVTGSGSLDFLPSTLPSVWGYLFGQSPEKAQGTSFFPKLNSPDFFQAKSLPLSGVYGHCWLPASFARPSCLIAQANRGLGPSGKGQLSPADWAGSKDKGTRQGRDFLCVLCAGGGPVGSLKLWRVHSHLTGAGAATRSLEEKRREGSGHRLISF